jgi:hypothetical protein
MVHQSVVAWTAPRPIITSFKPLRMEAVSTHKRRIVQEYQMEITYAVVQTAQLQIIMS